MIVVLIINQKTNKCCEIKPQLTTKCCNHNKWLYKLSCPVINIEAHSNRYDK